MLRFACAVLLVLSACMPAPPTPEAAAARCVAAFRDYDFAVRTDPDRSGLLDGIATRPVASQRTARENALRQFGCLTFPKDVPALEGLRPAVADLRAGPSGPVIQPQYLHVALVTDRATAERLTRFFAGLGYPVRTRHADRLGQRVYIGPVATAGGMLAAEELMQRLGFLAAYPVPRI